ncbi:hypothetical protein Z043_106829 [Scleropages formosus]|uniref:Glycosyltransferase 2-like domain-containing protein n=1 Tax=Scleropages formosus TaxID=113540 RepID=A0A0P7VK96_SCLFO|nr:hypothetical protein Z043_106829 [Scleropages formosus]
MEQLRLRYDKWKVKVPGLGPCDENGSAGLNPRPRKDTQVGQDGVRRKDWHDYEAIRRDAARSGNGEQGKAFPLTDADRVDQAYRENGFNIYVSDRISLNRSLPDIRHPNCKQKLYAEKLPNTSIIIPFHNEGWSSLLRTVHSVLNRSPPELIAEIILVDDFSDKEAGREDTFDEPVMLTLTVLGGWIEWITSMLRLKEPGPAATSVTESIQTSKDYMPFCHARVLDI